MSKGTRAAPSGAMSPTHKLANRIATEIDMRPEGWARYRLGEVASFRNGLNYTRSDTGEAIKIVGVGDFKDRSQLESTDQLATVRIAGALREDDLLRSGDLLFVRSNGNKELIGRCLFFSEVDERLAFSGFTIRGRVNTSVLDPLFASYLMRSPMVLDQLFQGGTGTNISNLSQEILANVLIQVPSLTEQRRISAVLATWDAAIAKADQLLQRGLDRRRGLTQELVLGRRRFPQFRAPWQQRSFGEVLKEVKRPVEWDDDYEYPLISVRRRSEGAFHRETRKGSEILTKKLNYAYEGEFLISKMQVVHGAMAVVPAELDGMFVSDSYLAFQSAREDIVDINFIGWLSTTPQMYKAVRRCSYGVHIEKMTFDLGMFLHEKLQVPAEITEQKLICDVLESAQAEVDSAANHLELLKKEKAALMSNLLSGKRRVKQHKSETESLT